MYNSFNKVCLNIAKVYTQNKSIPISEAVLRYFILGIRILSFTLTEKFNHDKGLMGIQILYCLHPFGKYYINLFTIQNIVFSVFVVRFLYTETRHWNIVNLSSGNNKLFFKIFNYSCVNNMHSLYYFFQKQKQHAKRLNKC